MRLKYFLIFFIYFFDSTNLVKAQFIKLKDFDSIATGRLPWGSLISDGAFLYGMTTGGGLNKKGVIFKVNFYGSSFTKLLDFSGSSNGNTPYGSLISDGNFLYGMTSGGGTTNNYGTIFKIKPDGSGYLKLIDFTGNQTGAFPFGSLVTDSTFLYGMTRAGGFYNYGALFKVKNDGTGYINLFNFDFTPNGGYPVGSLTLNNSVLYGMTEKGGFGCGTIFKIKTNGSSYKQLLNFTGINTGCDPYGSLFYQDSILYGMTNNGGSNGKGMIFRIKSDSNNFVKLLDFNDTINGAHPTGSLIYIKPFFYGMTSTGGIYGFGTIFRIKPDGSFYEKIFDFTGAANGKTPCGDLFSDGISIYGMASNGGKSDNGIIFKQNIPPDITGISKNNTNSTICIFPNPFSSQITIQSNNNFNNANLSVYNVFGQLLREEKYINGSTFTFLSNDLEAGIYFLQITQDEKMILTKKIVLQE